MNWWNATLMQKKLWDDYASMWKCLAVSLSVYIYSSPSNVLLQSTNIVTLMSMNKVFLK